MQSGHAVDSMTTYTGEMSHAYTLATSLVNQRQDALHADHRPDNATEPHQENGH